MELTTIINSLLYCFHWFVVVVVNNLPHFYTVVIDSFSVFEKDVNGNTYDYIIVGGGSAGSILASRLSEDSNLSVLLLEAGVDKPHILNIPAFGTLMQLSKFDWQYVTVPQEFACYGLENNSTKWASGKLLGGTTHLNYMLYVKGYLDYSLWNSTEWSYPDILYYFNKAEKHIVPNSAASQHSSHSAKKGSILVRDVSFTTPFSEAVINASIELGYNKNTRTGNGFTKPHVNMNEFGRRWTSDQYLKSCMENRKNLKVITSATAEKILLRNDFEAYAVEFRKGNRKQIAYANQEVILSAGAIGSPKLLMLSGIGPEEVLSKAKIVTKIDSPVGKNLQDHVTTGIDLIVLNTTIHSMSQLTSLSSIYSYFVEGSGPFTTALCEAVGFLHSDLVDPDVDDPDLEFMAMMGGLSTDRGLFSRHTIGIKNKLWEEYFAPLTNESITTILPVLLHPKSVGEIALDSKQPDARPLINPRYLSNEKDVETLIRGIRIVQKMLNSDSMKNFGAKMNTRKLPGCEEFEWDTNYYWECYVRHITLTGYHPVGTCKMAEVENGGVVDHKLRVHGVNRLRVVDASIMPAVPGGNTNAFVIMIAEKGADLIKKDYYEHDSCQIDEIFIRKKLCRLRKKFIT